MKISTIISCVLTQIISGYVLFTYAVYSTSDLWIVCFGTIIAAGAVEFMVIEDAFRN